MTGLQRYLKHGARIPGWLTPYSATFIAELSRIQRDAGIVGGVGEIGVYAGRLFILLKLLTAPDEKIFAVDIFEDQHLNLDGSGGDLKDQKKVFLENVGAWCGDQSVEIIQRSSFDVRAADILARVGPCRLVSVDGGHTEECVNNDLRLIEAVLMPMGVAVLDDCYNQYWPGVAAGTSRYLLDSSTALRPFAITPNKVYLAQPAAHDFYRSALRASQEPWLDRTDGAFGSVIDIYRCVVFPRVDSVPARIKNAAKALLNRG